MELKEIKYILTIADEGSISKAAEHLFMAQSSLSQFLRTYEDSLGTKLFTRTAKGVVLTYSGEKYVLRARQILHAFNQMQNELWDIEGLKSGRILYGVASLRGSYLMPPILKRFAELYPNVEVKIIEANSFELEEMLLQGTLDMAMLAVPLRNPDIDSEILTQEEIFIACQKGHPVLRYAHIGQGGPERPWIRIEDAAKYEFILSDKGTLLRAIADRQFSSRGLTPKVIHDNITAPFAMALAAQGLGLVFMHQSCISADSDMIYLSIGPKRLWRDLLLAFPSHGYRSNATKALARLIHQMIDCFPPVPSTLE